MIEDLECAARISWVKRPPFNFLCFDINNLGKWKENPLSLPDSDVGFLSFQSFNDNVAKRGNEICK